MNSTPDDCLYRGQYFQDNVDFHSKSFHTLSLVMCVCGTVIAPAIVIGNGLVIVALLRKHSLRTPTNIFISTLALSDCFTGLAFIPLFMMWSSIYRFYKSCVFLGLLFAVGWAGCGASFLGMLAVSMERYLALFLHLKYETLVTVHKAVIVGVISWAIPVFLALLYVVGYLSVCLVVAIIILVPSFITITVIYIKIFLLVRRHKQQIHAQEIATVAHNRRQRKLAVTIGCVVGVSFLCYFPVFCASIVTIIVNFTPASKEALGFCAFLFTFSSFCNPFIYCHRNQEIRGAVWNCLRDLRSCIFGPKNGIPKADRGTRSKVNCDGLSQKTEVRKKLETPNA